MGRESTFCELESILLIFSALSSCGMSVWVWGAGGRRRGRYDFEVMLSFTEAHTAYNAVKLSFYEHSISEHDEQNILNLKFMLFFPEIYVLS
jgi:predicted helicase